MCTSLTLPCPDGRRLFGRTLDWCDHFGERPTATPRGYLFDYGRRSPRAGGAPEASLPRESRYGMAGMASDGGGQTGGYPLYAEAMNERGLCMAGLRFARGAQYVPADAPPADGMTELAPWELIPYVLGLCATVAEAKAALSRVRIADMPFPLSGGGSIPTSPLHWHIAATAAHENGSAGLIVEQTADGLCLYEDEGPDDPLGIGVMANDPPYPRQLAALAEMPDGEIPGGYGSAARFVRAARLRRQVTAALPALAPAAPVARFFHLLASVAPPPGCGRPVGTGGRTQYTLYAVCMDGAIGLCHYLYEDGRTENVCVPRQV